MMRTAKVALFASLRETAGINELVIPLPAEATVGDLRKALDRFWPGERANLVSRCAVAVNGEYASNEVVLAPSDEIALIPPVSGG